jgi:hypothetical protein
MQRSAEAPPGLLAGLAVRWPAVSAPRLVPAESARWWIAFLPWFRLAWQRARRQAHRPVACAPACPDSIGPEADLLTPVCPGRLARQLLTTKTTLAPWFQRSSAFLASQLAVEPAQPDEVFAAARRCFQLARLPLPAQEHRPLALSQLRLAQLRFCQARPPYPPPYPPPVARCLALTWPECPFAPLRAASRHRISAPYGRRPWVRWFCRRYSQA